MSVKDIFFSQRWNGRDYLVSPVADVLLTGGGALIALTILRMLIPGTELSEDNVLMVGGLIGIFYVLSFVVNNPHFMMSYQILYAGYAGKLRKFAVNRHMWWRYVIAGILAPLLIVALLAVAGQKALIEKDYTPFALAYHLMFFFVGWHYMKQAYGMFIMFSALKKIYYGAGVRRALLANSYSVWLWSWTWADVNSKLAEPLRRISQLPEQVPYSPIGLPDWVHLVMLVLALASTLTVIVLLARAWAVEGKRPSVTAVTGYLSMYYLFALVALAHPLWFYAAPFFHSLQYIHFVWAYRRGKTHKMIYDAFPEAGRHGKPFSSKKYAFRNQTFYALAFLLGVLSFYFIPKLLDAAWRHTHAGVLEFGVFAALFSIFINIHHYFIDNVIWRKENEEVGPYLFRWSRPLPAPEMSRNPA